MWLGTLRWRVACLFTSPQSHGCSLTRGYGGAACAPSSAWHQKSEFKNTTVITVARAGLFHASTSSCICDLLGWGREGSSVALQVFHNCSAWRFIKMANNISCILSSGCDAHRSIVAVKYCIQLCVLAEEVSFNWVTFILNKIHNNELLLWIMWACIL